VPGRGWEGVLTHVPSTVTMRGTRTVGEITCAVDNTDQKLLPNVNVSVNVVTAVNEDALTVPREAVHQDDGRRYVWEIVNGELKRTYVETSISNLTRIAVTKGLNEGATVVLGSMSVHALREGQSVRIVQQ
jgi:HlyD family secretion protein